MKLSNAVESTPLPVPIPTEPLPGKRPPRQLCNSVSLMCVDFVNLGGALDLFSLKKVDFLHVDVMDGHFVPNFTLGPDFSRRVGEYSGIPLDIHLMIENVDTYIPAFAGRAGSLISFHPEVVYHPLRTINLIRQAGCRPGIAVDPAMPLEQIKPMLPDVDFVVIMTVNPGYAGQSLVPQTLDKVAELRSWLDAHSFNAKIEVDGNVSWQNLPRMIQAGAEIFVTGSSSVFEKSGDLAGNLDRLNGILHPPLVACA